MEVDLHWRGGIIKKVSLEVLLSESKNMLNIYKLCDHGEHTPLSFSFLICKWR